MSLHSKRAFTFIELLIVIAIILVLLALLLPALFRHRESARRFQCAANLRQIGQAILLYSNDQRGGAFPRTRTSSGPVRIPTWGTNPAATQPFAADGPADNDVTAALFLLLRTQDIKPDAFVCPSTWSKPDTFAGLSAKQRSNFTSLKESLSYSYQNRYPDDVTIGRGYFYAGPSVEFAIAADINPGTAGGDNILIPIANPPPSILTRANSNNHNKAGQNILFGDGHVAWSATPLAGVNKDNIYTTADFQIAASPYDANDSILLPTDD